MVKGSDGKMRILDEFQIHDAHNAHDAHDLDSA